MVFSLACVRNTRSPQMIGVEFPSSGKGVFQRTFSVALQVNGKPFSAECPCPSIPRQAGQLSASPAAANVTTPNNASMDLIMINLPGQNALVIPRKQSRTSWRSCQPCAGFVGWFL